MASNPGVAVNPGGEHVKSMRAYGCMAKSIKPRCSDMERNVARFLLLIPCVFCVLVSFNSAIAADKSAFEEQIRKVRFKVPEDGYGLDIKNAYFELSKDMYQLGPCVKTGLAMDGCISIMPDYSFSFDANDMNHAFMTTGVNFNGGSGTHVYLWGIYSQGGKLVSTAPLWVGDRILINSTKCTGNSLTMKAVVQGENDALCCPTKKVVLKYVIEDGKLVDLNKKKASSAKKESEMKASFRFFVGEGDSWRQVLKGTPLTYLGNSKLTNGKMTYQFEVETCSKPFPKDAAVKSAKPLKTEKAPCQRTNVYLLPEQVQNFKPR